MCTVLYSTQYVHTAERQYDGDVLLSFATARSCRVGVLDTVRRLDHCVLLGDGKLYSGQDLGSGLGSVLYSAVQCSAVGWAGLAGLG